MHKDFRFILHTHYIYNVCLESLFRIRIERVLDNERKGKMWRQFVIIPFPLLQCLIWKGKGKN